MAHCVLTGPGSSALAAVLCAYEAAINSASPVRMYVHISTDHTYMCMPTAPDLYVYRCISVETVYIYIYDPLCENLTIRSTRDLPPTATDIITPTSCRAHKKPRSYCHVSPKHQSIRGSDEQHENCPPKPRIPSSFRTHQQLDAPSYASTPTSKPTMPDRVVSGDTTTRCGRPWLVGVSETPGQRSRTIPALACQRLRGVGRCQAHRREA